jgi:hypothetical protein
MLDRPHTLWAETGRCLHSIPESGRRGEQEQDKGKQKNIKKPEKKEE